MLLWCTCALAAAQAKVALEIEPNVPASLAQRLESAIAGQLADLAVREGLCAVRVTQIDVGLKLELFDRERRARGVRSLSVRSEELAASEAGSVVRAFVLALRDEELAPEVHADPVLELPVTSAEEPAVATAVTPAPAPVVAVAPPSSPSKPVEPTRLWLTALYTGEAYAPQLAWQSGVRAELAMRVGLGVHAGVGYAYHPPATVSHPLASIRVRDHGPSALLGMLRGAGPFSAGGELAFGLTDTRRQTSRVNGAFSGIDPSSHWSWQLAVRARARMRVVERLWLDLAPALELAFGQRAATVDSGAQFTVLSPRTARFRLDVGASFELL
ncbi:MAG TPA: hypothetical protein VFX59_17055 [Polyangiales bacterium]|nr:hypothetical protein [Polyangiales bacterium]